MRLFKASVDMYTDIFMDQQLQVVIDFVTISTTCPPTQRDIALFLTVIRAL